MIPRLLATLALAAALAAGAGPVSDDVLFDQVRIRIAQDREVGADKITVKVEGGVVELTGTVQEQRHRERAEKLAKKVKGVKSVQNKLRVSPV
jgi:hyperosmotically inducible periplasmic protein